jgi:hypothetical protein
MNDVPCKSSGIQRRTGLQPKLINGKVWVPDSVFGGYRPLPENDPKYTETLLWIDSQRFVELLDWVYSRDRHSR